MLDPRIYRTGLVVVVLAVIVFAFSLEGQPGGLSTTLPPDAFSGQNALNNTNALLHGPAGSVEDSADASTVAGRLRHYNFSVQRQFFRAATPTGKHPLENVIGVRSGTQSGTIVVVAHRDAGTTAGESGTGVLLELARVLSEQTLNRTLVLASTTGSTGAAGAARLIRLLPGPIDAVIVLGDMGGTKVRQPVVVPWSNSELVAPPMLRRTVGSALNEQAGLSSGSTSLPGQFLHLAFPFTVSEQSPFGASGVPAVLLSTSGERPPSTNAPPDPSQLNHFGSTVLQTITALDSGPTISAPSAYLLLGGNVIPAWAIRLLVLGLILPVLGATIDGFARARRRGHAVGQWVLWVLEGAVPFVLALALILAAKAAGWLGMAPPGPIAAGAVPIGSGGAALLAVLVSVMIGSFVFIRRVLTPGVKASANPGSASALLLVLCALTLVLWISNPFAAALLVPALHLWLWATAPDVRIHPALRLGLVMIGLLPLVLGAAYYMLTLGYNPIDFAWALVLMIAGGHVGVLAVLEWSVALGCALSIGAIGAWTVRHEEEVEEVPVTVRGPVTYAGPGSLGGTESALRR